MNGISEKEWDREYSKRWDALAKEHKDEIAPIAFKRSRRLLKEGEDFRPVLLKDFLEVENMRFEDTVSTLFGDDNGKIDLVGEKGLEKIDEVFSRGTVDWFMAAISLLGRKSGDALIAHALSYYGIGPIEAASVISRLIPDIKGDENGQE